MLCPYFPFSHLSFKSFFHSFTTLSTSLDPPHPFIFGHAICLSDETEFQGEREKGDKIG